MPPRRVREKREGGRLEWRKIRISHTALKIWGLILMIVVFVAVGSVVVARYRGKESFIGRLLAVAGRKVDQRLQLLTAGDQAGEVLEQRYATISFYSGSVKIQRATEMRWRDAAEGMRLESGDRVRTFSNSRTEITFDDGNVLRVKPDSLIVIGDLTENVRTKVKKSSVRLLVSNVEADIRKSVVKGSKFELLLPTATAEVEKARLAVAINPDEESEVRVFSGKVEIDTGQERVELSDSKRVMISALKKLTKPSDILPAPRLKSPRPLESFLTNSGHVSLKCSWDKVPKGRYYRLEIATDRFFDELVFSREDIKETVFQVPELGGNVFFARVAAADARQQVGAFSDPVPFRVIVDRVPPFLEVQKFVVLKTGRGREVLVNGQTEPRAKVEISSRRVEVDQSGFFTAVIKKFSPGQKEIEIIARDQAGNVRSLRRSLRT